MTVIDFYLARITEDEAAANETVAEIERVEWVEGAKPSTTAVEPLWCDPDGLGVHVAASPARVLADCQAKRRIVEMYHTESDLAGRSLHPASDGRLGALADVIQILAAVYADHEDWNPDWGVSE